MTNERLEQIRQEGTEFLDRLKDRVHEQQWQIDELYERIFILEDEKNKLEEQKEKLREMLVHSHLTLEEMEKIGEILWTCL